MMGKNERETILLLLLLLFAVGIALDSWLNHRPLPWRLPVQPTPESNSTPLKRAKPVQSPSSALYF